MQPRLAWLVGLLLLAAPATFAEDYPARTVTIVNPFAPGGGTDLLARMVAQNLEQRLGDLKGIVRVERIDGRPEFRLAFDWTATDTSALLRGVLDMGVTIVSFAEERRHLNEAFMDLTHGGIE